MTDQPSAAVFGIEVEVDTTPPSTRDQRCWICGLRQTEACDPLLPDNVLDNSTTQPVDATDEFRLAHATCQQLKSGG